MKKSVTPAPVVLSISIGGVNVAEELQQPDALEIIKSLQTSAGELGTHATTPEARASLFSINGQLRRVRSLVEAAVNLPTGLPKVTPEPEAGP